MMHPCAELRYIPAEKGFGVVATECIPKGTITWVADALDQHFTEAQLAGFDVAYRRILDKYCYRDAQGLYILCWDIARYVNHSYQSNCLTTPYNFELAVRDILPGEELTDDYGYLNVDEPLYFPPEAGTERTAVYPDDLLRFHEQWDRQLMEAFACYAAVAQPLAPFVESCFQPVVAAVGAGRRRADSILNCYYRPGNRR